MNYSRFHTPMIHPIQIQHSESMSPSNGRAVWLSLCTVHHVYWLRSMDSNMQWFDMLIICLLIQKSCEFHWTRSCCGWNMFETHMIVSKLQNALGHGCVAQWPIHGRTELYMCSIVSGYNFYIPYVYIYIHMYSWGISIQVFVGDYQATPFDKKKGRFGRPFTVKVSLWVNPSEKHIYSMCVCARKHNIESIVYHT